MDYSHDSSATSGSNPDNIMVLDSETPEIASFAQTVDRATESEMKKIEVQKMEGELTIKALEQTYRENKKNFIYAQKKLGEARKKAASQAEQINQLVQANIAIVEKFNELKNYQNEIIVSNTCEVEETFDSCKQRNSDLSSRLEVILNNENIKEDYKKAIGEKKSIINNDIERQIEEKKVVKVQYNELLGRTKEETDNIRTLFNHDMSDQNYNRTIIEQRMERITQMEADEEAWKRQTTAELENLEQKIVELKDCFDKNIRVSQEKEECLSKLQIELSKIETLNNDRNELLIKKESERHKLLIEVPEKRENKHLSKKALDEKVADINDQIKKVENELEAMKGEYKKEEDRLTKEISSLRSKIVNKRSMEQDLENCQAEFEQFKEERLSVLKESSNLEQEVKSANENLANELKKYEQILLDKKKKQSELDDKIKKSQEEKNSIVLEAESCDKDRNTDKSKNNTIKSVATSKTQNLNEIDVKNSKVLNEKASQGKSTSAKEDDYFGFGDSDSSEDEKISKNTSLTQSKIPCYKKSQYDHKPNEYGNDNKNIKNESMSDILFEDLLSQTPSNTQTCPVTNSTSNDEDVFKVPQPYSTPVKRKYTHKYNKK